MTHKRKYSKWFSLCTQILEICAGDAVQLDAKGLNQVPSPFEVRNQVENVLQMWPFGYIALDEAWLNPTLRFGNTTHSGDGHFWLTCGAVSSRLKLRRSLALVLHDNGIVVRLFALGSATADEKTAAYHPRLAKAVGQRPLNYTHREIVSMRS